MASVYDAELRVSRHAASIVAVQRFFAAICESVHIADRTRLEVELALEEGLSNLLKFAMSEGSADLLRVRLEFGNDAIRIVALAPGRPFDFHRLPTYEPLQTLDQEVVGLGNYLLNQTMDSVQWRYVEKEGQELTMVKGLPSPLGPSQEDPVLRRAPGAVARKGELTFRRVSSYEDALALSTCAYDIYRYAYKDVVYYPDEVVARNRSGQMRSWIAVDEAGVVFGHYAMMRYHTDDPAGEMGAAFVRPQCRKDGLFQRLSEVAHDDACRSGIRGLFSLSVTNHIATQKTSEKAGRRSVGIRLASTPAIFIEGARPGDRVTSVLNYRQLVAREPRLVFPPHRYRDLILRSYEWLGIPVVTVLSGETGELPGNEFLSWSKDSTWNRAVLAASGAGENRYKLRAVTESLVEGGIACILLSIDLQAPGAPQLAEDAASLGYFYSGLSPESMPGGHDALQLQFLNGLQVDPADVLLYQESAHEIMAYIRREAPHVFMGSGE